jgi:hypothetical protein
VRRRNHDAIGLRPFIVKINVAASMLQKDKTFYQLLVRPESHSQALPGSITISY